jgi:hypothetical protein
MPNSNETDTRQNEWLADARLDELERECDRLTRAANEALVRAFVARANVRIVRKLYKNLKIATERYHRNLAAARREQEWARDQLAARREQERARDQLAAQRKH